MTPPKENSLLIYGREYHCWRKGEYIGTAVYADDENIGDSFLREIGEDRVLVLQSDVWEFAFITEKQYG